MSKHHPTPSEKSRSLDFILRTNGMEYWPTVDVSEVALTALMPKRDMVARSFHFRRLGISGSIKEVITPFREIGEDALEIPWRDRDVSLRPGDVVEWKFRAELRDGSLTDWSPSAFFACAPRSLPRVQWIGGLGYWLLRKTFTLPKCAKDGIVWMVADPPSYARETWDHMDGKGQNANWSMTGSLVKYRLYINGQFLALGPPRSCKGPVVKQAWDSDKKYVYSYNEGDDVQTPPVVQAIPIPSRLLQRGKNTIAIIALGEKRGVAAKLMAWDASATKIAEVVTDGSWESFCGNRIFSSVAWHRPGLDERTKGLFVAPGEFPQHLNGLLYPYGWSIGKDKGSRGLWRPAQTWGAVRQTLEPGNLPVFPYPLCRPGKVKHLADGSLFFDFGHQVFGSLILDWPAPGEGEVEVRLGEELTPDGRVRYIWRTKNCLQESWLRPRTGGQLEHFGLRAFRYGSLHGEAAKKVRVHLQSALYPTQKSEAQFKSSCPELNRVWELCRTTIKQSPYDLYTDCLSRERVAYEGDTLISMLSHHCLDGDTALARRTFDYLMYHPTWPQEWRFMMPLMLWKIYQFSGNPALIHRHLENLVREFSLPLRGGLVHRFPQKVIVDWPPAYQDQYDGDGDFLTVPNAFFYAALLSMAKAAQAIQNDSLAKSLEAKARRIKVAFHERLWDGDRQEVRDHPDSPHSSFHANLAALRFGLVPPAFQEKVIHDLKARGMVCSVFYAQFYLEALYMHREARTALQLMTRSGKHGWIDMIDRFHATTTMEAWDMEQKGNISFAHPWGTAPLNNVVRGLMGVRPAAPGWKRCVIDPQLGNLEWAELVLPTPRGSITLQVQKIKGKSVMTHCRLPQGMQLANMEN